MIVLFWFSLGILGYTYLVYPALLFARARLTPRPYRPGEILPRLTVVIAAHNEAQVIGERIDNLLACDYPDERREILVSSDGSQDATVETARRYEERGVRVLDLPRAGKAAALNAACAAATGEIIVFTDANTIFASDTLRALVRPFADQTVGGVAGDQRYLTDPDDRGAGEGERQYWNLDRWFKLVQSRAGSVISATGAIYALRRALYQPIPSGVTDDFYASTAAIAHGYRLVFAPEARAYEPAAPSASLEFGRKVRVITQGLAAVAARRQLLDPRRTGFYALQLWSQKVLRRIMVLPLAGLLVSTPFLWSRGVIYQLAAIGLGVASLLAILAFAWSSTRRPLPRLLALLLYVGLVNLAALIALTNVLRGRRIDRWAPQRSLPAGGRQPARPLPSTEGPRGGKGHG